MVPFLVVDDVEEDLILAERVLRQCKILNPIQLVKSGNGCIAYFEGSPPYENRIVPCIALLALIMPIPGIEVLKYLQNKKLAKDSVIVVLSGLDNVKGIREGYQLGAHTFLIKPINQEDVLQMVNTVRGVSIIQDKEGYIISLDSQPQPIERTSLNPFPESLPKARP